MADDEEPVGADDDQEEEAELVDEGEGALTVTSTTGEGEEMISDPKLLPPTKRYAPKEKRVYIPFELPWENRPILQSQRGMRAFGTRKDPVVNVDQGEKPLVQGSLHTETFLTMFAASNAHATQAGTGGFGKYRNEVTHFESSKPLDPELIRASEGIIPLQAGGGAPAADHKANASIGAMRLQVPRIKYQENMSDTIDMESNGFIHKLMAPNPISKAGSSVIDHRRTQTEGAATKSAAAQFAEDYGVPNESISKVSLLWDTKLLETANGTGAGVHGLGAFRQVTTDVWDNAKCHRTRKHEQDSIKADFWQTSGTIASYQQGTGGYGKHRDVSNHFKPRL